MDRILSNFVYAFILTRSTLELLPAVFGEFVTELWPLIGQIFISAQYILRTNGHNFTKFCTCIHTDKNNLGIVTCCFCKFVTELWPLIDVKISFPFNILRTNGQNFIKFCVHTHIYNRI